MLSGVCEGWSGGSVPGVRRSSVSFGALRSQM